MEYLQFMFASGFFRFLGCFLVLSIIISAPLKTIAFLWNRFFRHWNIRKHGYPPAHCDADGDFKEDKKD